MAAQGDEPARDRLAPALAALDGADAIELFSIEPKERPAAPGQGFHNWKVLGRTTLRGAEARRAMAAAIRRGIDQAGEASGCFEPRHGLRAGRGAESVDLVICFSCGWIEVHGPGASGWVRTTGAAKDAMNAALRGASVPLAQDVEGP